MIAEKELLLTQCGKTEKIITFGGIFAELAKRSA